MAQISPDVSSGPFTGNGVTTAFAFTFSIVASNQIKVTVDGAVVTTGFTVAFGDTSGTVTFAVAPAVGAVILLESDPDYRQTSNFANEGAYNLSTVNLINKRGAIRDLVLKNGVDRALKLPVGSPAPTLDMTDSDGKVLGYAAGQFLWVPNDAVDVAAAVVDAQAARDLASGYADSASDDADQTADDVATIATMVGTLVRRFPRVIDLSAISTTTLAADPDLTVPIAAGQLMVLRGRIAYATGATADFKYRVTGPASPARVTIRRRAIAPGDTAYSGIAVDTAYHSADVVVAGAAGTGYVEIDAEIQNGATAGNIVFSWGQNASEAVNTTVYAGAQWEAFVLPTSANITFANGAIAKLGGFNGPTSSGGHNVIIAVGPTAIAHSYIETMVTGTQCDAQLSAGSYSIEVDGVVSAITAPTGWSYVRLFSGMTDGPHRLRVTGVAYDSDIALRVAGTAPSVARPSDIPNFYPLTLAPYNGYIARDAPGLVSSPNTYPTTETTWLTGNGFGFRFGATTTSIRIWYYDGASQSDIVLLQDGVALPTVIPPGTTGTYNVLTIATGLSGAHNYELIFISSQKSAYGYAVLVDTLTASTPAARASDAYYGDSIVAMSASPTLADARVGDSYILAHSLGRAAVRVGVGGTGVSVDASGNLAVKYGRDHTADITGLPVPPTRVFVCYGVNDVYYGVSTATFQADYQTMLAAIRTGLPSAKIYCRGILPNTRSPAATPGLTPTQVATLVAAYNAAMQAAVTAIADANIVYVSTLGWIDPVSPSTDTLDGLHPAVGGYAKIAAAQALVL